MSESWSRRRRLLGGLFAMAMVLALLPGIAATAEEEPDDEATDSTPEALVALSVPNFAAMTVLLDGGYDLLENVTVVGDGYVVDALVTEDELAELAEYGIQAEVVSTAEELEQNWETLQEEWEETVEEIQASVQDWTPTSVTVLRADYYTSTNNSRVLSIEARTVTAGTTLQAQWNTTNNPDVPNSGGQANLSSFSDAGQYLYHRGAFNVAALGEANKPTRVRVVRTNNGDYDEKDVEDWLGPWGDGPNHRYFAGFHNRYLDATEATDRIEQLHAEFPELTELIETPYLTNGYARPGMALFGNSNATRVGITSNMMGHEGGEDITVQLRNPGAPNSPLAVNVAGTAIVVDLGTSGTGALNSTAAQVVNAINANEDASALVHAYTYRGNAGTGTVAAAGSTPLNSYLSAPDHVERGPFQTKVLRIGTNRDGSKTGVLAYAMEHSREWVPPMVVLESAERLLRNYHTDHKTRQLVDNLDIFIYPIANPDGHHFSRYDNGNQRRTMTNHCPITGNYDLGARNTWGVDQNRNYTVGTQQQGYSGASTSCTSDTYRGPSPLSEPEAANVAWIPAAFPNIKFSMNLHSSGNYFMWSPGAYVSSGRVTLPRPSFGTEQYFWQASERILTAIKQHRGLSVTPARTGPIVDVLYSAAGNSGDMMYYEYGLYGWNFEVGTSFQPNWNEAYNQMMEYSNGLVEMFDVALDWTRDRYAPTSWVDPGPGEFDGSVGIKFFASEPVDIYYTLDGSNPTYDSLQYQGGLIRQDGEVLIIDETTTIKWFSVDQSGNVEAKYQPSRNNPRTATFVIND